MDGTVVDNTGAAVPDAKVTVVSQDTGVAYEELERGRLVYPQNLCRATIRSPRRRAALRSWRCPRLIWTSIRR